MLRNAKYYEEHYIYGDVQKYYELICELENEINEGIYNEDKIRLLNDGDALKVALMEGKLEVVKKVLKPIHCKDGRYKILVDAFSTDFYDYIKRLPNSLMEAWNEGRHDNLVITRDDLKQIEDIIFNIPREIVEQMKIKDVLARQISGWNYPVYNINDVTYYSELSNLYPSIELFKKNIRTVYNDTNGCYQDGDVPARSEIRIDYTNLSESNRVIADTLVETNNAFFVPSDDGSMHLSIVVDCNREDTIAEVNSKMFNLIKFFNKQDVLYGVISFEDVYEELFYTIENYCDKDLKNKVLSLLGDDHSLLRILLALNELNMDYVFDSYAGVFWKNIEYFKKHAEYIGAELKESQYNRNLF